MHKSQKKNEDKQKFKIFHELDPFEIGINRIKLITVNNNNYNNSNITD